MSDILNELRAFRNETSENFVTLRNEIEPGQPGAFTVSDIRADCVTLSWEPPAGEVQNYSVTCSSGEDVVQEVQTEETSVTIRDLRPGQQYLFSVCAQLQRLQSEAAETSTHTKPGQPGAFTVSDIRADCVTLSWEPPAGEVQNYSVTCSSGEDVVQEVQTEETSVTIRDLRPGQQYLFSVCAQLQRLQSEAAETSTHTNFKDLFHERDQCQKKAAEFTERCLKAAVEDSVNRSLGLDIVDKMLTCEEFSTRVVFQHALLLDLLEQDNFQQYLRYTRNYENYVKDWILTKIDSHSSEISEFEKKHIQSCVHRITEAVNKAKDGTSENMKLYVKDICKELNDRLVISKEALDTFMVLNNADTEAFSLCLIVSVDEMGQSLSNKVSMDIKTKLENLHVKPQNEVFTRVIGCGELCPFCKAPCDAGGGGHTEHWASLHRPQAFALRPRKYAPPATTVPSAPRPPASTQASFLVGIYELFITSLFPWLACTSSWTKLAGFITPACPDKETTPAATQVRASSNDCAVRPEASRFHASLLSGWNLRTVHHQPLSLARVHQQLDQTSRLHNSRLPGQRNHVGCFPTQSPSPSSTLLQTPVQLRDGDDSPEFHEAAETLLQQDCTDTNYEIPKPKVTVLCVGPDAVSFTVEPHPSPQTFDLVIKYSAAEQRGTVVHRDSPSVDITGLCPGTDYTFTITRRIQSSQTCVHVITEEDPSRQQLQHLPKLCAQLLIDGFPLELVDGDASNIPLRWVSDVLTQLHDLVSPNNKILVVTVLGVQSTGKSTLLNTMFGVQFAVSSGRCTRGAFMLLIRVSEDMKASLNCDFLVIIDTEGLKSPEL
uniref:Uncharacterized protein n=1 Tax=Knipowitschia caucasica TaxID=637954 RepID=A0AAV2KQM8_KNICA